MLQFFTPTHKVQKDRTLMHDTDSRIAKYSRRGLVLNFIVFALCLFFGDFFQAKQGLAIFLLTGLLVVTLLRSYFLFRFETHYARAPGRWRNQYFLVSFIGAIWWSVILVSLTFELGMRDETLIMWLYSVVFYSSVANVFAPYQRFLSYYLFIGQVPAALTAIFLGTVDGYLYGTIMLMFFYMLNHQGKVTAKVYWEHLEANYALKERAKGLEDEKLDSLAAIDLKNEFLSDLGHEFRTSLNDVLGSLSLLDVEQLQDSQRDLLRLAVKAGERQLDLVNNVADYAKISARELVLDQVVFNLRRNLEVLVENMAAEASQQGVELHYIFDPDMPARVRGDATRMTQIIANLLGHAIHFSEMGQVVFQASFLHGTASGDQLKVLIRDEGREKNNDTSAVQVKARVAKNDSLNLAICKALARCMGGGVQLVRNEGGQEIAITLRLEEAGQQSQRIASNPKMAGKSIILVDVPTQIALSVQSELEEWGIEAEITTSISVLQRVAASAGTEHLADMVFMFCDTETAIELASALKPHDEIKLMLAIPQGQEENSQLQQLLRLFPAVRTVTKPVARQVMYDNINSLLFDICLEQAPTEQASIDISDTDKKVLLVDDHRVNQMVASGMLKKLGYKIALAGNGREAVDLWQEGGFDLVLMDCQMPEMDGYEATREIRRLENESPESLHIPIIAMTAHAAEGDQARCLAAGMDDYLVKPMRLGDLQARLKRWLGVSE